MTITPIASNIDTKPHVPYKDVSGTISTEYNAKPLKPQGHLVHDSLITAPKYFIKDIAYDMKALKDGLKGNANDHQLGRLNDVGLKIGGVSVATILAANTSNPMMRLMEYVGLGSFLAAMSLYPKLAVNLPSRIVHGFDIGKEYIDDQGRKKSVLQDPNYIPFDMYRGDFPGEDLEIIGDRLGVPRGIKNRDDVVKEQMRKIGIQNNTLWMMTAGAVPVFAALMSNGFEKLLGPVVENLRNSNYNSKISKLLDKTAGMSENVESISSNSLSKNVENILSNYKNKELPSVEIDNLIKLLTKNLDANLSDGIKTDLKNILSNGKNGQKSYFLEDNLADELSVAIKKEIPSRNKTVLENVFSLNSDEIKRVLDNNNSKVVTEEELQNIKGEFRRIFESRMDNVAGMQKSSLKAYENKVLEAISKKIKSTPSNFVNDDNLKTLVDFAKVIGEFKENQKALDKCKSFKVEYAPETVLARSYAEFERTLFDVLNIKYKELNQIRNSEKYAQEILEQKLNELAKDENKYKEAIEKLTRVISDLEIKLNGKDEAKSNLVDLISGIENNYNNTAKRLNTLGKFRNTIDKLIKQDVSENLKPSLNTREELHKFLDGEAEDLYKGRNYWDLKDSERLEYVKYNSKGVGSSKNQEISRIIERYQGATNSFNRILHAMDVFKRPTPDGAYNQEILKVGKKALLNGTSSEHTLKLGTVNNPVFYRDIMYKIWDNKLQDATQKGLEVSSKTADGNVSGRFRAYIERFRNIIGNNSIDFTKPQHFLNKDELNKYKKSEQTRMTKFNLVGQSPVDMLVKASERKYSGQKWLRITSGIGGAVLAAVLASQFGFGKIKNPHNLQKQVENDSNK